MLKKQDLGINPYVPKNGSRDQSLIGIGGPRVYVQLYNILVYKLYILYCCTQLYTKL